MGSRVGVVHSESCPDIGAICDQRDEPPQLHDQHIIAAEFRLLAELGLSKNVGIEVQVPVRLASTDITYRRLSGEAFVPDYTPIHHRNETLAGLGDPVLLLRRHMALPGWLLVGRVGLQLPVGETQRDPFALGRQGLVHQHIQFGTGTVDPVLEAGVQHQRGRWQTRGVAQARLSLYQNGKGFQAGNRILAGVQVWRQVVGKLAVGVSADALSEFAERWDGRVQQDGNVGRTDVLLGLGVALVQDQAVWQLTIKRPVVQYFHISTEHGQLQYPFVLELAWSWLSASGAK